MCDGIGCTLSKITNDTKLGKVADTPEVCVAIQRDLNRLEKWASRKLTKLSKKKCKVLHLGMNNPRHENRLGTTWLGNILAGKKLGVLVNTKLNMSQQWALVAKKAVGYPAPH